MSPEQQPEDTAGTPVPDDEASGAFGEEMTSDSADAAQDLAQSRAATQPAPGPPARQSSGPRQPDLRTVEFSQVIDQAEEAESGSLEMLMDIRLPVSVELGRTQTFVRDILDYGPGTVVELDKLAGDPVDILVNGKLVAQGEVVVIDDHFGVRITVLLSPKDRVRSLGG